MAQHAAVVARLVVGGDSDEALGIVTARARIVIAGDDGGTVVTGIFAYNIRGALQGTPL